MTPERWRTIEAIFEKAFDLAPDERAAFLDQACGLDAALRAEVESLLAHRQPTGRFLSTLVREAVKLFPQPQPGPGEEARFIPGTVIQGRYRVIGLLGKGGMGEVYRADDLKLRQPVALKFLPEKLANNGPALERFHHEVRTARQISHPNVCRVFDIGEAEGLHFLSMEYIDGEDLSSLLRRIGRLPEDKAVEIARQICAGLAAAHKEGVLHRDLKPANVMIDGRGRARLTDFGLAGVMGEFQRGDLRSGTPVYMAPEQLAGKEVSVKSDLYALGLVLYELLTGKKAFSASTLEELIRLKDSSAPASISSVVKDVDPLVERVILRCLESDPDKRPESALSVAAALPGADPLAAALAAGVTPSPEMVAAAPKEGSLRPAIAVTLFASVIAGFAIAILLAGKLELYNRVPLEKTPEVLREKARDIIRDLGYTGTVVDDVSEFDGDWAALRYITDHKALPDRWQRLQTGEPAVFFYWYRQSPNYLEPLNDFWVRWNDPPQDMAGMTALVLDTRGRLRQFYGVPDQVEAAGTRSLDWSALFKAAGFEMARFRPVQSRWLPPYESDARAAWQGVYPGHPQIPIRIEAAALRGRPIYFQVVNPWDKPERQEAVRFSGNQKALLAVLLSVFATMLIGSLLLAVTNLRRGRGDRKGAMRLGVFILLLEFASFMILAHHVPTAAELGVVLSSLAYSLFPSLFYSIVYLALEPYVRRRWPHQLISWQRLLSGDWRDPMVGRDFLIGASAGVGITVLALLARLPELWSGSVIEPSNNVNFGLGSFGIAFLSQLRTPFIFGFMFLFLLLMLSVLFRGDRMGAVACWLVITIVVALIGGGGPTNWLASVAVSAVLIWVIYRYGLLAVGSAILFLHAYIFFPFTTDLAAWYAAGLVLNLVILLTITAVAFRNSLGGQPLLRIPLE